MPAILLPNFESIKLYPLASTFVTAAWRDLIMANYVVDPAVLTPLLPYKTELDLFEGKAYVSLVGFMFMDTALKGIRVPCHVNFEEVNLRFYVKHFDGTIWKRGTVFIREVVPLPAISFIANTLYHEKYVTKLMRHARLERDDEISLSYQWRHRKKWNRIEATVAKEAVPMIDGSETQFIAEHYWGYSRYKMYTTFEYEVRHPSWKVYPVKSHLVDCDFGAMYGKDFAYLDAAQPTSVLVAKGSPISIMKKKML
jgi:uncharacterized protein